MATYTVTKATLDEIAQRARQNEKRLEQAWALIVQAQGDLAAMQIDYSGFASELDTDAANNAGDPAWDAAKAEKDEMVGDFQATKTRADSLLIAYDSV